MNRRSFFRPGRPYTIFFISIALALLILLPARYFMYGRYNGYYQNPLKIPLRLSANFGELREDHFHMGLDIRTRGKENLPVFAAAGGYVSRIIIEEERFGNALLITHPNNTSTLYAHLNRFSDSLQSFIRNRQYRDQRWEQDILLPADRFPVKQGQFIAWSGNTGGSQGPHLHFELRDTRTGNNLDPVVTGLTGWDNEPPAIAGLYWYDRTTSTYQGSAQPIAIVNEAGQYRSKAAVVRVNTPIISLGIRAKDKHPNAQPLLGIAGAELLLDDKRVYHYALDPFSYADSRYLNACIDYPRWIRYGSFVQHLSTLPGNRMPVFSNSGNGLIDLSDKKVHTLRLLIRDAAGNTSSLDAKVQFTGRGPTVVPPGNRQLLAPGKEARLTRPFAKLSFSATAFYDTVPFLFTAQPATQRWEVSPRILLHNPTVPVHDSFLVQVKTSLSAQDPLRSKTVLQLESGAHRCRVRPQWTGNWAAARLNRLGTVQLILDTIAPRIGQPEWSHSPTANGEEKVLRIRCKDNLGRIAGFRALLNGQWLLFERKEDCFTYRADKAYTKERGSLIITATDLAGNSSTKKVEWIGE